MQAHLDNPRMRLDELLVARGFFASRSRARDAIQRATVRVDGKLAAKAGEGVSDGAQITVDDPARDYVSRAALKLIAALDVFDLDPASAEALDLGASTGGFTQVLLERGARHVTAVDVGHGQLHERIAADLRVTCIEGLNVRDLEQSDLGGKQPDFLTADLSFISLKLALPPALRLAAPGAQGVFLVKPQFEAGREAIGKGGLLRDPAEGRRIGEELRDWLGTNAGWRAVGLAESPIEGGEGNREFLLAGVKDA
jgi:23S rRNA (cytidine1920-2'-O)/16S rRNA (cytidine1409-2'-O)-methyltransferase